MLMESTELGSLKCKYLVGDSYPKYEKKKAKLSHNCAVWWRMLVHLVQGLKFVLAARGVT